MNPWDRSHLSDEELVRSLQTNSDRLRKSTAETLKHIAEIDAREAYREAGFDSMLEYCERELNMDEAPESILAARASRRCPRVIDAIAEGRTDVTVVALLAPYLTLENADELIQLAGLKNQAGVLEAIVLLGAFPDHQCRDE
ncbi:MAG TPA: hypothetical protein VJY35_15195 [Candidatus Eisenbacteria bacterium]|nr:hypothetical protein [Candidatus Eisenbacteria bacterium]